MDRARLQLLAIEQAYGISIANRDEAADAIAEIARDSRGILQICTSLNSWVALSGLSGEVVLPLDLIRDLGGRLL